MRSDRLYLADMLDAIAAIGRFIGRLDAVGLAADELVQSAALQKLSVIGEAAARLAPATREAMPGIPWKEIVGLRNIAVPAYFSVDWRVVHVTVMDDLPPLQQALAEYLANHPNA